MAKKYCYLFSEGNASMRELLGGKGANLAEMTKIGLPVPQGFTISTEACTQYYEDGRKINADIQREILEYIDKMEKVTGKKFGDKENPLLVSVRSGARASMPGMMDTILNLGLNEDVVESLAAKSGNPRWAWDCYRRFIQMFSDVVMEVGKKYFEKLIDKMKEEKGVTYDVELTADDLKTLANQFKAEYKAQIGKDFPSDPKEQLFEAVKAVFRSWDNPRANIYRMDHDIPYSWGTAVNVQMMAFGNMGDDLQTRNGKRTAAAAIKIACDLIDEGMITEKEALMQIDAKSLDMLLHPQFDAKALAAADKTNVVGKGIAASPGAAAGQIVFTAEEAVEQGKAGKKVVLGVRPEDVKVGDGCEAAVAYTQSEGGRLYAECTLAGGLSLTALMPVDIQKGAAVKLNVDGSHVYLFDAETRLSILGRDGGYVQTGRRDAEVLPLAAAEEEALKASLKPVEEPKGKKRK